MSTSIYKPLGLTLSARMPETIYVCSTAEEIRRVRKVLFEPPDHIATQKFVDEELSKIRVNQSEKWNFDFIREKTLNPNGVYQWRPATPQKVTRPIKTRPLPEEDIQELYANPHELIRPSSVTVIEEAEMQSPPKNRKIQKQKPQRLITDFMMEKKRSSEPTKKPDWVSIERPAKLPRLNDFTS